MAKNMQPIAKRCRTLGISPAVMGYSKKTSNRNPGGNMRRKKSEYSMQLTEKQKVKFIYGIMEKQFRAYYEKAEKKEGKTGSVLLTLIEHRLDNVVFRLGLASTRREARQLVNHAHFTVNGKKVNIPSYLVKVGDVIEVKEKSRSTARFKAIAEGENSSVATPKWLEKNADLLGGKVIAEPQRDDIDFPVEEHLIVELYSK
jgi:small subunit ribosomal protein S4